MIRLVFTVVAGCSFIVCMYQVWMLSDTLFLKWSVAHQHPNAHITYVGLPSTREMVRNIAATSILPACWCYWFVYRSRQRRRRQKRHCCRCGYCLTGNTSGTCPECGTPVPKAPAGKSPRPA